MRSEGRLGSPSHYCVAIVNADANGLPNGHYVDFAKTTRGAAAALAIRRR